VYALYIKYIVQASNEHTLALNQLPVISETPAPTTKSGPIVKIQQDDSNPFSKYCLDICMNMPMDGQGGEEKLKSWKYYCPEPSWLKKPSPIGCSHQEIQSLYISPIHKDESKVNLASSGYLSIKHCPENPEVILYSLMRIAQKGEYPPLSRCARYFIDKYFYFRSQSVADTSYHIAVAITNVSQVLLAQDHSQEAAYFLSRLYCERGNELPSYVAQGYGKFYAKALFKTGRAKQAIIILEDLIERFETPEEFSLKIMLDELEPLR
jgi:hypothetical protein